MMTMVFDGWSPVLRVMFVSAAAYALLVIALRASGKRTLSKMSAFDFVVTVALGSTLATVILSKDIALAEGLTALAMLVALQYVVAWASSRSPAIADLVKSQPALVFYRGELDRAALRRERLTEGEVRAAIRDAGISSDRGVHAVVLEANGELSVIPAEQDDGNALHLA